MAVWCTYRVVELDRKKADEMKVDHLGYEPSTKRILAAGWHMAAKEDGVALISLLRKLKDAAAHAGIPSDIPTFTKKDVAKIVKEKQEEQQKAKTTAKRTTTSKAVPPPKPQSAPTGPTLADPTGTASAPSAGPTADELRAQRRKQAEERREERERKKAEEEGKMTYFEPANAPMGPPRRHCVCPDSGRWLQGGCTREGFDLIFGTDAAAQWRKAGLLEVVDDGYGSPYGIPVETVDLRHT